MDYKLLLLGDGGVGKSALTLNFLRDEFHQHCAPTILDTYSTKLIINKNPCQLEILDMPGADVYKDFRESYIRNGNGFLLVYSVTSYSSFRLIELYWQQIRRYKYDAPVILVGNKCEPNQGSAKQVHTRDGREAAHRLGCRFFETSALSGVNVKKSFNTIAEMMQSRYEGGDESSETSTLCSIKVKKFFNTEMIPPWHKSWRNLSKEACHNAINRHNPRKGF